jgi:hypothetical protein
VNYEERKLLVEAIERLRDGRRLICLFNFDRLATPPDLPWITTQFAADVKEPLLRLFKELPRGSKIDLWLYT